MISRPGIPGLPETGQIQLHELAQLPLMLPSGPHGLRALLNQASTLAPGGLNVVAEIDGPAILMDAVRAGFGATIQPGAALARLAGESLVTIELVDDAVRRPNLLVSLSDDELSPAGLAARGVLCNVTRSLITDGLWPGARLQES